MRTITARSDIEKLFASGRRVSHPALLVLASRTPSSRDADGRVLIVAGKRLGGAVQRNRSKRVLREALRRAGGPWAGWDVALSARSGTDRADAAVLDDALTCALRTLGIRE